MHIQASTDYALRALLYLATTPAERFVPASEVAAAYGLSAHHVSKICKDLTARGWLEGRRGSGGGVRLAQPADSLRLGQVVAALEPLDLVECLRADGGECVITPGCKLKRALEQARKAFLRALDEHTLADLSRGRTLGRLLGLDAT
ncbi:MAG: Rrf2 family transcriptional regulator [Planctomycetota bacterium]